MTQASPLPPPYFTHPFGQELWNDEQLRALAAAEAARAVAVERERCAKLCEDAKASIWALHDPAVKQAAETVCDNLAARIRGA